MDVDTNKLLANHMSFSFLFQNGEKDSKYMVACICGTIIVLEDVVDFPVVTFL